MNFFSSSVFLEAAAEAFFAGQRHRIEAIDVEGRVFRVLVVGRSQVVERLPFLDFLEPISGVGPARALRFLPRVALESVPVDVWRAERWEERAFASPWVDWSRVSSWESFAEQARQRLSVDVARKRRKLSREVGAVRFAPDAPAVELLPTLMEWKSAQYRAAGLPDLFRDPAVRRLFFVLAHKGALQLSALLAGGRPVALHAGVVWEGRYLYWLPAYDATLSRSSPGTLHLLDLLQHSFDEGHAAFDFLLGDEAYKWIYATDVTCVTPLGRPSLGATVYGQIRERLMHEVRRQPRVHEALQAAKRLVTERGWLR